MYTISAVLRTFHRLVNEHEVSQQLGHQCVALPPESGGRIALNNLSASSANILHNAISPHRLGPPASDASMFP